MATDYLLTGYAAVRTLLTADVALLAAVRRFVWFNGDDPYPEPESGPSPKIPSKQPGDVPELKLDWDSLVDSQRTDTRTFGNIQAGSTCPFIETETHEYLITITVDDVRLTTMSAILSHVRRILRAGATVGVGDGAKAHVGRLTGRNVKTTRSEAHGHLRRVATLRVPVQITYDGSGQTA